MKYHWWRRLSQRIGYPSWWPTVFAFDKNECGEMPIRIGVSVNGDMAWYSKET